MMQDDDAGALFANLTSLLEDAAGLASEGQNPRLTLPIRRALLLQIGPLLAEAHLTTQRLSHLLDGR